MDARYILSGDPREVEKVIRENRFRQEWGLISIEPCPEVEDEKDAVITDTKDVAVADQKKTVSRKKKQ